MLSGALASMVTGVTEPLEFAFLFVAPSLYVFHAIMNGLAFVLCILLGVHHGISYSQGLIDFVAYWPLASHLGPLLWLAPLWAGLYFVVFYVAIGAFKLPTPGRAEAPVQEAVPATNQVVADALLAALGGRKTCSGSMPALPGYGYKWPTLGWWTKKPAGAWGPAACW